MSKLRPTFPFVLLALIGLTSCETLTELGRSMDKAGASLVRSLQAAPPASETVEVTQPLPAELLARREAGELRAALAVSDPTLAQPAGDVVRALKVAPQGEPLVVPAESAPADAWFAALAERAAAPELAESELLVAGHVATTSRAGAHGEARRELRFELRAFDRATQQPVFAARAVADDPEQGAPEVAARVGQLVTTLVARLGKPEATTSSREELQKALLALVTEQLAATQASANR